MKPAGISSLALASSQDLTDTLWRSNRHAAPVVCEADAVRRHYALLGQLIDLNSAALDRGQQGGCRGLLIKAQPFLDLVQHPPLHRPAAGRARQLVAQCTGLLLGL